MALGDIKEEEIIGYERDLGWEMKGRGELPMAGIPDLETWKKDLEEVRKRTCLGWCGEGAARSSLTFQCMVSVRLRAQLQAGYWK